MIWDTFTVEEGLQFADVVYRVWDTAILNEDIYDMCLLGLSSEEALWFGTHLSWTNNGEILEFIRHVDSGQTFERVIMWPIHCAVWDISTEE